MPVPSAPWPTPSSSSRPPRRPRPSRAILGNGLRRRVVRRPHPRPARRTPPTCPPPTRASPGPASASTSTTTSSRSTWSPRARRTSGRQPRKKLKDADELYLATDEDREGEAIAWHLLEVLNPPSGMPVRRMVFHEITPEAIQRAIDEPRDIDRRLVDAQEARRILDRLYGYEVTPVLWKKVQPGLSAGRVQSVATRIVVERERARMRFRSPPTGTSRPCSPAARPQADFGATLVAVDGTRLATGKDFDEDGQLPGRRRPARRGRGPAAWPTALADAPVTVRSVESQAVHPQALRPVHDLDPPAGGGAQAALRLAPARWRWPSASTRTATSPTCGPTARRCRRPPCPPPAARSWSSTATDYLPDAPRHYTSKVKNAQEAHEAIRPAGDRFRAPEEVPGELGADELRLYELIWQRTVASQMTDARGESVPVRLGATASDGRDAEFAASGQDHPPPRLPAGLRGGLRRPRGRPRGPGADPARHGRGRPARHARSIEAKGHETQPPARFTEASLVTAHGGARRRPAVDLRLDHRHDPGPRATCGRRARPSCRRFTAFAVITLLEQHFPDLVDYAFTARMEDELDEIASGDRGAGPVAAAASTSARAARTATAPALKAMVSDRLDEIDAREINSIPIGADADGRRRSWPAPAATGPTCSGARTPRRIPEDLAARRADPGEGGRAPGGAQATTGCSARTPRPASACWPRRAASAPTSSSATSRPTRSTASRRRPRCSRR